MIKSILLICATDAEYTSVQTFFDFNESILINKSLNFSALKATNNDKTIYLIKGKVGKVNSSIYLTCFCEHIDIDLIVNIGVCGSLNSNLKPLDILLATKCAYYDVDITPFGNEFGQCDEMPLYFIPKSLPELNLDIHKGLIVSSDSFTYEKSQIETIKKHFPDAIGVDMESTTIGQFAHIYNKEFIIIRSISDSVQEANLNEIEYEKNKLAAAKKLKDTITYIVKNI